ncbi:MAG: hypothetical protein DMG07_05105 [Acidobacteria bacterium]|nr:MAG: hypothetical protein DMG07_05105 [Acidobacteriota bacterium]
MDEKREKTLLIYGMYDVQPVSGQDWSVPPFAATIRELPGLGQCLVARGACNSKGPLIGFINALSSLRQSQGELPSNFIFTIEGEEEVGSRSIEDFYRQHRAELKADTAFEPFWAEYGTDVDRPTVALGTKGIVSFQLECRGGDWGGAVSHPVHSSVAAWIGSPTWRLIRALSLLVDVNDDLNVPGLWRGKPPSEEDEALLAKLAATFDEKRLLALMGAHRFKYTLRGADLLRKYYFSPTIHVTELLITDGDTIPTSARANISMRLVPGMAAEASVHAVREHLAANGFGDIVVTNLGGYPAVRTSLNDPINVALLDAYEYHGCQPQVIPLFASASPMYLFTDVLGIPYGSGGLGKAGGSHGVDEFFTIEGFKLFEKSIITLLYFFANRPSTQ